MIAVFKVFPEENLRVAFMLPNGTTVYVHFLNGELRACGANGAGLTADPISRNVLSLNNQPLALPEPKVA